MAAAGAEDLEGKVCCAALCCGLLCCCVITMLCYDVAQPCACSVALPAVLNLPAWQLCLNRLLWLPNLLCRSSTGAASRGLQQQRMAACGCHTSGACWSSTQKAGGCCGAAAAAVLRSISARVRPCMRLLGALEGLGSSLQVGGKTAGLGEGCRSAAQVILSTSL
jgi:hypothetical protein